MLKADTGLSNVALESGPRDDGRLVDATVVDWDGTNDAANPLNWPSRKRWAHVIMVAILALITYAFLVDGLEASHLLT